MTEKQYSYAWTIANTLNIQLPRDWSTKAFADFINDNLPKFQEYQKEELKKINLRIETEQKQHQSNYELAKLQDALNSKELYEQGYDI